MKTSISPTVGISVKIAVILMILLWTAPSVRADSIVYSITLDTILNNPNGTWGGNLLVGANQNLNLTVAYTYNAEPSSFVAVPPIADFDLIGLQVFDNTNGLASNLLLGNLGRTSIRYRGVGDDAFAGHGFEIPGGNVDLLGVSGELGNQGDELPFGPTFDALVNASPNVFLIARAPDSAVDNVFDRNGTPFLQPGAFTFTSSKIADPIPEPSSMLLFGTGIAGLAAWRWKKRQTA